MRFVADVVEFLDQGILSFVKIPSALARTNPVEANKIDQIGGLSGDDHEQDLLAGSMEPRSTKTQ